MSGPQQPEDEWQDETDTVEAKFGDQYSEDTLELLRRREKPRWMEEESVSANDWAGLRCDGG